ncbi:universal stress protein [Leptolyngbya sp. PCC 6406]|uniref:universal stress protein n=1 Tax=Leptolyngbya sp. PCC 6406 TaxID=1173264 RepID=UPI0002AC5400|nr:universal stress protein [Leptolyngbya sp. PCC 6406]
MFQRALICTDFSDGLHRLAQVMPSLVAGGLRHITFFHNVAVQSDRSIPRVDEEAMAEAHQRLEALLADVPAGAEVEVQVMSGRPSDNILRQVESQKADVVVLGMPTRSLLTEKLFGSTTMGLVDRTPVPLLILRPQLLSTYTLGELDLRCRNLFRYLLIPYDGSESAERLIDNLQHHLADPEENRVLDRCLAVWVVDDAIREEMRGDHPLEAAKKKLDHLGTGLRDHGVTVETLVKQGDPLEEIMRAAEEYDICAIAACHGSAGGFMRWSAPSLTREILRRSWHPVLYIPDRKSR